MTVYMFGCLSVDMLPKPGKGWQEKIETLKLGVEDGAWVAGESSGQDNLRPLLAHTGVTVAPSKIFEMLSRENPSLKNYQSVELIFEMVLADVWVPELEKKLVEPYKIMGQLLPRWRLRFEWDLAGAPYHGKEIVFDFAQVNAVKATRVKTG